MHLFDSQIDEDIEELGSEFTNNVTSSLPLAHMIKA
jgi:hypothetical protein